MPLGEQSGRHVRDAGLLISVQPLAAGLPVASEHVETFGHQFAGSGDPRTARVAASGFRARAPLPGGLRVSSACDSTGGYTDHRHSASGSGCDRKYSSDLANGSSVPHMMSLSFFSRSGTCLEQWI